MTATLIRCSKLDAALAQLHEAIFMYFNERDPLATHTLVAAAHQILSDLYGPSLVERSLKEHLGPELARETIEAIRYYQNFLKHADWDPDRILDFDPSVTEYLLQCCALIYVEHVDSNAERSPNINTYQSWFMVHHPTLFKKHPKLQASLDLAKRSGFDKLTRPEFYRQGLEAYRRSYGS